MADSLSVRPFKGKFRVWNGSRNMWWSAVRHFSMAEALAEVDKFISKGFSSV